MVCQGTIDSADSSTGALYANSTVNSKPADVGSVCNALFSSPTKSTAQQGQRGFLATSTQWVQFIQWTETNQQIVGQLESAQIDSTNSLQLQTGNYSITGVQNGDNISISISDLGTTLTGTLSGNTLTLVVPQQDGTLATEEFRPATVSDYNSALAALQQGVEEAQASATAAARSAEATDSAETAATAEAQANAAATASATAAAISAAYTQISQQCDWNSHPIIDPSRSLTAAEHDALVAKVQKLNDAAYGAGYQPEVAVCIVPSSVSGDIEGAAEQYRDYWSLGLFILVIRQTTNSSQNQVAARASQEFSQKARFGPTGQPITQAMQPLVEQGNIDGAISTGLDVATARVQSNTP